MKIFQTPVLRNFKINPALLEKPQTLPFDMPADKKERILSLLLWGLNSYQPDFLALDYEDFESSVKKRHANRIKGIKVDKNTVLCVSVRSEKELRDVLKIGRRVPSLMMVINILNPKVSASRRWLFQLKNEAADAIRKTIYENKRIDKKLLDGHPFDFCLKNFEDPIDVIEFLDLTISVRLQNKEMEEAIDEAFITMVRDKISVLKPNQLKVLLSFIFADNISDIQKLTSLSEEEIGDEIKELQIMGMVHRHGKTTDLPLYLKNLKKTGLLAGVIEQMKSKIEKEEFDEIEDFYFRLAKELKPKEMIEQIIGGTESISVISYPFLEIEELDRLVLSLKAPFIEDVSKEIKNPNRMIEISNEVLFEAIEERIRGIALSVRALAYIKKGNLEESIKDIDTASKVNQEVSNFSARFYLSYGDIYRERANYEDAIECYDTARKLANKSGEKLWIAQAMISIAEVHTELANYEEAEKLCREGLKIAEELGDTGKRGVAQALDLLGNIQYSIGNDKQAIEYFEQALSIDREVHGDRHPDVAGTLNNIGSAWYALGEHKKAISYFEQALSIDRKVYGDRHPAVATYLNNIGGAWHVLGEPKKAISYFEQALSIDRKVYGDRHPTVARDLNNIGGAWYALGEPKKAISYYEQALSIDREVYGDRHPAVARNLNNIGLTWYDLEEPKKAISYYEQALSIDRKVYGDRHPAMAKSLSNIGSAWKALGEPKKAISYYEQALSIDREVYGDRHPDVATYLNNIGSAWKALGDSQRAKEYFQQAYSIFRQFYGDKHPNTRTVKERLDSLKGT